MLSAASVRPQLRHDEIEAVVEGRRLRHTDADRGGGARAGCPLPGGSHSRSAALTICSMNQPTGESLSFALKLIALKRA